jgi:hypothetical protein
MIRGEFLFSAPPAQQVAPGTPPSLSRAFRSRRSPSILARTDEKIDRRIRDVCRISIYTQRRSFPDPVGTSHLGRLQSMADRLAEQQTLEMVIMSGSPIFLGGE